MAPRRQASLKPQLNQIRTWVQEGATDIWIAHRLGSTPGSIASFRRQHGLTRDGMAVAGTMPELSPEPETQVVAERAPRAVAQRAPRAVVEPEADGEPEGDDAPKRRRRGRRGGRGRRPDASAPLELEGVFDHGDDGYGLWLDGAVREAPVYQAHWAGVRELAITVRADEIVIRRAGAEAAESA